MLIAPTPFLSATTRGETVSRILSFQSLFTYLLIHVLSVQCSRVQGKSRPMVSLGKHDANRKTPHDAKQLEQEEYVREEINWTFIEFSDNQMCIDVIEGKMGILTLLDEESRLPAGADQSFAGKLFQQINKPEQKDVFKKPRFNQNAFTIAHYAHDVTYDVEGFIEKNRDTVPDEHLALLQNSSNPLLKDCLEAALAAAVAAKENTSANAAPASKTPAVGPPKRAGGAASTRKPTLGSIFKHSLTNLMDTINNTNVHYIRCIKPNEAKNAWEFDSEQVLSQLRACGVLETIKISCAGYPNRWTFEEFAERYERYFPLHPLSEAS
jgi:myosin-5